MHVQAPVFRAKFRARFLQLADIFLSSGMVPAYTAAAFIKKFARLALTAPPAGELMLTAVAMGHTWALNSCLFQVRQGIATARQYTEFDQMCCVALAWTVHDINTILLQLR